MCPSLVPHKPYLHLFSLFFLLIPQPPRSTLFPYTTLFRSRQPGRPPQRTRPPVRGARSARRTPSAHCPHRHHGTGRAERPTVATTTTRVGARGGNRAPRRPREREGGGAARAPSPRCGSCPTAAA